MSTRGQVSRSLTRWSGFRAATRSVCDGTRPAVMDPRRATAEHRPFRPAGLGMRRLCPHVGHVPGRPPPHQKGDVRRVARGRRGCPRLVHGADPLRSKRRCGRGVGNPTSISARGIPRHRPPRSTRPPSGSRVLFSTWLSGRLVAAPHNEKGDVRFGARFGGRRWVPRTTRPKHAPAQPT